MRKLKIAGIVVAALVAIVVIGGLALPSDYRVTRSIQIEAPPQLVFEQVNSFKQWNAWSPWIARDKTIKNSFSGPEAGKGAKVSWTSDNSGEGSQEIVLSEPHKKIETALDFGEAGVAKSDFVFEPAGNGVKVTWGLSGDIEGVMGGWIRMMMDGYVGADYEDGLARLKKHAEGLAKTAAK